MRKHLQVLLVSLFGLPHAISLAENNPEHDGDWFFVAGLRATHEAEFSGAKDTDVILDPVLYARYDKGKASFWTKFKDWGVDYSASEKWLLGVGLSYIDGRKESDDDAYIGLGEIDDSIEARLDLNTLLTDDLTLQNRFTVGGADRDFAYALAAIYKFPAPPALDTELSTSLHFGSGKYLMTEFGVSQMQAASSGYRVYEPDGGFISFELALKTEYQVRGPLFTFAEIKYEQFGSPVSDSPFINDDYRAQALVGVSLMFPFRK